MSSEALLQKLEKIKSSIALQPDFAKNVNWSRLEKIFKSADSGEKIFKDFLVNGSCFDRFIAIEILKIKTEITKKMESWDTVQSGFAYFDSNLIVKNHLPNKGVIVVEGDLLVEGNYFNDTGSFTSLIVGGKLTAQNIITSGEVISADSIELQGLAYFHYNDHCALSPRIKCQVLAEEDREDFFSKIEAPYQFTANFDRHFQKFFGIKELPGDPEEDDVFLEFLYKTAESKNKILNIDS